MTVPAASVSVKSNTNSIPTINPARKTKGPDARRGTIITQQAVRNVSFPAVHLTTITAFLSGSTLPAATESIEWMNGMENYYHHHPHHHRTRDQQRHRFGLISSQTTSNLPPAIHQAGSNICAINFSTVPPAAGLRGRIKFSCTWKIKSIWCTRGARLGVRVWGRETFTREEIGAHFDQYQWDGWSGFNGCVTFDWSARLSGKIF